MTFRACQQQIPFGTMLAKMELKLIFSFKVRCILVPLIIYNFVFFFFLIVLDVLVSSVSLT